MEYRLLALRKRRWLLLVLVPSHALGYKLFLVSRVHLILVGTGRRLALQHSFR